MTKIPAWHAGRVAKPTWSLIKSKGPGEYINPNFYTIGIEHEGYENTIWTDEMYAAGSELIRDIARRWNIPLDRNHIIGHHEIYAHKTCPGHTVDINKLIAMAAGAELFESSCTKVYEAGKTTTVAALNIRRSPSRGQSPVSTVGVNVQLAYDGYTNEGENVNGNPKWYFTEEGNWFWSGGVK
jgi:N-acetylmuramoyl-L-alanine amidase